MATEVPELCQQVARGLSVSRLLQPGPPGCVTGPGAAQPGGGVWQASRGGRWPRGAGARVQWGLHFEGGCGSGGFNHRPAAIFQPVQTMAGPLLTAGPAPFSSSFDNGL